MAQNFSISNKGSTPRIGVSSPATLQSAGLMPKPFISPLASNTGAVTQGTNQGLISPYTHTTTTNQTGGTTSKPTPNKSVLAQQQALNKLGAGLVEDGIAGPKTQAAIAKYGTGQTSTGTKSTSSSTGMIPEKPKTYTPENLGVGGVSQGGLIGNAVQQSQEASPEYKAAQEEANRINQQIEEAKKQMAQQTSDINQSGTWTSRALGEQGQANIQNAATLAALGSQYQGATSQIAAANAAQQLKQAALGTAIGANAPVQVSPTNIPYSPSSGTYGAPASTAYGTSGLAGVGGILQQQEQGAQTQNMIGAYNQAAPLIETAKQQIKAAGFNVSPLALGNALVQWVNKDVVPSAEYANIFNTLTEIATTISPVLGAQGSQTNLKTMIAQEFIPQLMQGKDIGSVLDNIEKNALAKINAQKSTAIGKPLTVPTTSGGTSGALTWDDLR